jgi:hypothetical protein
MAIQYTQDSTSTSPFGIGWHEQAVATSKRLIAEREAKELELSNQLNDGPYSYSNVRNARNAYRALAESPAADPAEVTAAKAKFDELQAARSDLNAQSEQNSKLLEQTRDGLRNNEIKLAEASAKAATQPPNRPIVNAGNDPAANSTPPVVSPTNITGAVPPEPPLNVTTPASLSPPAVPASGDEALQATQDAQAALAAQQSRVFAPTSVDAAGNAVGLALQDETGAVSNLRRNPETGELYNPGSIPLPETVQTNAAAPVSSTQSERDDAAAVDAANKVQTTSPGTIPPSQTGYNGTAYDDEGNLNPGWTLNEEGEPVFIGGNFVEPATAASAEASRIAAGKQRAQEQQTLQARKNQPAAADWRVRLQLAAGANYLYKAGNNGSAAGILQPLYDTDGVIFPYTPQIDTSYTAKYDNYDLVHSNYRGYFYKNSSVDNLTVRGTFTAQDTKEAQYLLAVIHFFRSVTKMFYGQDAQAGTPPPLVYLSGLGQYQFNNHPCVVSNFTYNLPNDVDYIRANGFNNFGINLENRRDLSSGPPQSPGAAARSRLVNSGLGNGSLKNTPAPQPVNQNVTNPSAVNSTYVPTKMEISVTLLPMQTRSQVSKQFSLEGFAQGRLLQGGFW